MSDSGGNTVDLELLKGPTKAIGPELHSGATTDSACPAWRPPASATGKFGLTNFPSEAPFDRLGQWHRSARKLNYN